MIFIHITTLLNLLLPPFLLPSLLPPTRLTFLSQLLPEITQLSKSHTNFPFVFLELSLRMYLFTTHSMMDVYNTAEWTILMRSYRGHRACVGNGRSGKVARHDDLQGPPQCSLPDPRLCVSLLPSLVLFSLLPVPFSMIFILSLISSLPCFIFTCSLTALPDFAVFRIDLSFRIHVWVWAV